MPKQMTLAALAHATKKKVTRREKFLTEMDAVVPWSRLLALIEPHYPKIGSKGGRPAMPLGRSVPIQSRPNQRSVPAPKSRPSSQQRPIGVCLPTRSILMEGR